jgi:gamma-glutamyltranspeptidase/glutathione hydrolase
LLKPAISCAADGVIVTPRLAGFVAEAAPEYSAYAGYDETYKTGGRYLPADSIWRQPRLARALETIAREGARGFYDGWVASDIARSVADAGGLLAVEDLAAVTAEFAPALSVRFRNVDVFSQPPVSQGAVLLRALRLIAARTHGAIPTMPEYWMEAVRALRIAFGERLALLGDFPDRAERAAAMIDGPDPGRSGNPGSPFARQGTETTTLAVMDRAGNAVSLILSVFADLGSGVVARESGVLLNNRLSGFFLEPGHPNVLRPGRRSMTTLHSFLVQDAHGVRFTGGSPGGDVQPQVNLQLIVRMIDFGETPAEAIAAPRWAALPGTVPADLDKPPFARIDASLDPETRAGLVSLGCRIVEATDNNVGSQKIVGRNGENLGAWCDRRRDAAVAAI